MEILTMLLRGARGAFTLVTVAVFVATGLFMIFVEAKTMAKKNLKMEERLVKAAGVLYIVGSIVLYALFSFR
ncbi:MAG: CLC_0170 family protein [Bacillota bacterium]|nr:MAG: hypothetical protein DIU66_01180 [Bacillota bacterium]